MYRDGKKRGYWYFLLFPQSFQKLNFSVLLAKLRIVTWKRVNSLQDDKIQLESICRLQVKQRSNICLCRKRKCEKEENMLVTCIFFFTNNSLNSVPNVNFFGQDQIQSSCRQRFQCFLNYNFCLRSGRKHYGKRRKCWLPAFSPFSTMFSSLLLQGLENLDCVVKDLTFILKSVNSLPHNHNFQQP